MTYTYCCVYTTRLVEFHSKNKFEKLVHLAGFIIRIRHDARSSEYQIAESMFLFLNEADSIAITLNTAANLDNN